MRERTNNNLQYNIPFKGFNFTQIITLCLSAANLYGEIIGVKNNKHNDDQRNEKNVKIAFRFCTLLLLSNCCHSPNLKTIAILKSYQKKVWNTNVLILQSTISHLSTRKAIALPICPLNFDPYDELTICQ